MWLKCSSGNVLLIIIWRQLVSSNELLEESNDPYDFGGETPDYKNISSLLLEENDFTDSCPDYLENLLVPNSSIYKKFAEIDEIDGLADINVSLIYSQIEEFEKEECPLPSLQSMNLIDFHMYVSDLLFPLY